MARRPMLLDDHSLFIPCIQSANESDSALALASDQRSIETNDNPALEHRNNEVPEGLGNERHGSLVLNGNAGMNCDSQHFMANFSVGGDSSVVNGNMSKAAFLEWCRQTRE